MEIGVTVFVKPYLHISVYTEPLHMQTELIIWINHVTSSLLYFCCLVHKKINLHARHILNLTS